MFERAISQLDKTIKSLGDTPADFAALDMIEMAMGLFDRQLDMDIEFIPNTKNWKGEKIDVAVITGYLLPENKDNLSKIESKADKVIAYGDCTTTGGIFGLANQKGANITAERLRFDFSFERKMVDDEIKKVESLVNEKIRI